MRFNKMNDMELDRFMQQRRRILNKYGVDTENVADYRESNRFKTLRVLDNVMQIVMGLGRSRVKMEYFPGPGVAELILDAQYDGINGLAVYVREKDMEIRYVGGFARFDSAKELVAWVREWRE